MNLQSRIIFFCIICKLVSGPQSLSTDIWCRTRFANAARVDDFNSRDVFSPERERTIVLLSAFINFVKFTEQYCDVFLRDLRDRSDAIVIQRNNAAVQLRDIQGQFDELRCAVLAWY